MNEDEIFVCVKEVFSDVLGDSDLQINQSTSANDVEEWDSLSHINIVASLESRFGIKFMLGELQGLKDVGEMVSLIGKKLQ